MKGALERVIALVVLVVIGLYSLTHACVRGGCVRYSWASAVPFVGSLESAMMIVALFFLAAYVVGGIR